MGEGTRRADEGSFLGPIFKRHQYRITHRIPRREHIRVPDTQYLPTLLLQKLGARCIVSHLSFASVCCTINLDNQLGSAASKICEV
jgi:hypothetical protein